MSGVTEHLQESARAVGDVFRNHALRRINAAFAGSIIGDWAHMAAMSVYAYQRGGATTVGVLAVVRYVTMAVLGPIVATFADHHDRRRVMLASDLIRAVLVVATAVVAIADGPSLAVYVPYVLTSWVGLAFRPAQSALMPSLATTPTELTAANVTAYTIHSVGFFVGPAIAGGLLAIADVGEVFLFNAATFVWSAAMVWGLHPRRDEPTEETATSAPEHAHDAPASKGPGMFASATIGYRTILRSRDLRLLMGLYMAQTVVAGASAVFDVAIALDLLDLGESGVGVLGMGLGVGGIIGGVVALLLSQRGKLARDFGLGVMMWAAPLLLVSAWPTLPSALISMAIIGLGNSVVDVNAETIIQRLAPDEVMGRVFGAMDSAAVAGMALGSIAMPVLIHTTSLRTGLAVIGIAITAIVVVAVRGLARIDRIALAPEGLELLRAVPMLGVLPDNLLERLARTSNVVEVARGTSVFHQGDAGDRFYVIERGEVEVVIDGRLVNELQPGDSFGELALLRDAPRAATISARTDLVLRAIDRRHFLPAVTGHSEASEQAEMVMGRFLPIS